MRTDNRKRRGGCKSRGHENGGLLWPDSPESGAGLAESPAIINCPPPLAIVFSASCFMAGLSARRHRTLESPATMTARLHSRWYFRSSAGQKGSDALPGVLATPLWLPPEGGLAKAGGARFWRLLRSAVSQSGVAGRPAKTSASLCPALYKVLGCIRGWTLSTPSRRLRAPGRNLAGIYRCDNCGNLVLRYAGQAV